MSRKPPVLIEGGEKKRDQKKKNGRNDPAPSTKGALIDLKGLHF